MVEGLFADRGDSFRSALMFRVTVPTFLLFLESPVKALFVIDVFADIFVAIQAELRLGGFVESLMAFRAVIFPFCVPLDHLTGHQGGFNGSCRR